MAIFNSFLYVYQRVNGGYGRCFSLKSQKMTPWRVFCGKTCRSASPQVPIPKITICTNHPQSFPLGGFLSHGVPPVIIHFFHVQRMFPWKSTIPKSRKIQKNDHQTRGTPIDGQPHFVASLFPWRVLPHATTRPCRPALPCPGSRNFPGFASAKRRPKFRHVVKQVDLQWCLTLFNHHIVV